MFLRKEKRNGRIYLSIVQGYREKDTGKSKQKRIKTLGYLDELEKEYDDPIDHFTKVVKDMTDEYNDMHKSVTIEIDPQKKLTAGTDLVKNFGYAALSNVYHELELNSFFQIKQRELDIEFNLNSVAKLLIYGRVLFPGSKKAPSSKSTSSLTELNFPWPILIALLLTLPDMKQLCKNGYMIKSAKATAGTHP